MEILWFGTLAVLVIGYFALEGFDIGVGMLLPVLGRTPAGRDRLAGAMAPFVLANEVWLVAFAGVLFGAFPALEGTVLGGLRPLVIALLSLWILRDAGLWFRRRADGRAWRACWDGALFLGSAGLAVVWGMALTALARGRLSQLDAIDPLNLAGGVVLAALLALHGWTFAAWRLPGEPVVRGARRSGRALLASACLAAAPAAAVTVAAAGTILDHAAPVETLTVLGVIVVPCVPILAGAQLWIWRTFGKGAVPTFF